MSSGDSCELKMYEKYETTWNCILETYGVVGKNGVSNKSREGDMCTPEGIYSLGFAFGIQPVNDLNVEYRQINDNCYWIDDPFSPLYNQWVESSDVFWNSAEHMIDYPQAYKYAVVIEYNTDPVISGKGSAIFLHCMTGNYTAGCVAVPENDMLYMLKHLNQDMDPMIIIE